MTQRKESLSHRFIRYALLRGHGERSARESLNELTKLSPSVIAGRVGKNWTELSGTQPLTPKETHRIYSALGRKARKERTEKRTILKRRSEDVRRQNNLLGIRESAPDYQAASDAGLIYRSTKDESYRADWEKVSP
jgi:hypothetical protein